MRLEAEDGFLTRADFVEQGIPYLPQEPTLQETAKQLTEYFAGRRQKFTIPLRPAGTAFQMAVWDVLQGISYGETIPYGEEAKRLGRPSAARAVAGANGRNPISIIIPCHRVVAANGIGGYWAGVEKKRFLLTLEQRNQ